MQARIKATPKTLSDAVRKLCAGTELTLKKGRYRDPITITAKRGMQTDPIVIRGPKARIGSDVDFEGYRKTANGLAAAHQAGGSFPGLYFIADNAALIVRDCQWVVIEDLWFENCWPTAIYLDNCQHVVIRNVHFRGGTFAIGAAGPYTRHILVEGCDWVQDLSGHGELDVAAIRDEGRTRADLHPADCKLWSDIDWKAVHGAPEDEDGYVDENKDARAYDGDFFRAWTIAGYVILRNNIIVDAFNGIHFFNKASVSTKEEFSRNVLVENNWFVRIRDNAVEPEDFAWNWTIRSNKFVDCYMPFSFEMGRSGFFYVYGNLGWNFYKPGPEGDTHAKGQLFKFPPSHESDGPHYVFNNTWRLRWPIVKKFMFSSFVHMNNLIGYATDAPDYGVISSSPFGKGWDIEEYPPIRWNGHSKFEQNCFTRRWRSNEITFDGDIIDHPHYPNIVKAAGYPVGVHARSMPVIFDNTDEVRPEGLKAVSAPMAIPFRLEFPDCRTETVDPDNYVVGAWQRDVLFTMDPPQFVLHWPMPAGEDA